MPHRINRTMLRPIIASILVAVLTVSPARADDVRIYAAGAVQKAVVALIPEFEARTGHKVVATYDTVGALANRVKAGEKPDLVVLSQSALKGLETSGQIAAASIQSVGRTGVGLAGNPALPAPDVSTADKLKAALLAAPSIVHADPARGATAGTHFAKVLVDLGIAAEVKERVTVIPFGGAVADEVASGKFAIGVSQASEIVPNPKVRFLGFLPEPHALWTVYAVATVAAPTDASRALLATLIGPEGQKALEKIGFQR
jgi:molybdate transport system substrate-binding protein